MILCTNEVGGCTKQKFREFCINRKIVLQPTQHSRYVVKGPDRTLKINLSQKALKICYFSPKITKQTCLIASHSSFIYFHLNISIKSLWDTLAPLLWPHCSKVYWSCCILLSYFILFFPAVFYIYNVYKYVYGGVDIVYNGEE